jgi:DNA topoisomerase IA
VLPDEDFKMIYEIKKESKKHVDNILAKEKTADVIYLAFGNGHEGEAIARN